MEPNYVMSVVLPAYNEESTIEETVETTMRSLESFMNDDTYEIVIAEDGCNDDTPQIADALSETNDCIRHFHSDTRLGRGGALNAAFRRCKGTTLVYFDTDLATDMQHLETLVEQVRSDGYDIATGSRWLPASQAERPADRQGASWMYNQLVRLFLSSNLQDHQCGFKAFDRDALLEVLPAVENDHWFWDTEVLVRAQARGFEVTEFPVEWIPKPDTKVDLIGDSSRMGKEILRLWWDLRVEQRLPNTSGSPTQP